MVAKNLIQVTDPKVTRRKFIEQLDKFAVVRDVYQKKGIVLLNAEFPSVSFLFALPKLNPAAIAFAIRVDFTNFDAEPPSVVFINPFNGELVRRDQIRIAFIQLNQGNVFQPADLVQGIGTIAPFLCIPGVREYHEHAAHSGDSWFLYRTRGEGELLFILDQLYIHSIGYAKGYQVNMIVPNLTISQEISFQQPLII